MVILVGMLLNFFAISINGNRMPVKTDIIINNNEYFSYQDNSEVKAWLATDWINIKDKIAFSLGDIILVLGALGLILTIIKSIGEK